MAEYQRSTVAGLSATAAESLLTFPLDFIKTQSQLCRTVLLPASGPSASNSATNTFKSDAVRVKYHPPETVHRLYTGFAPSLVGNLVKAAARFSLYNAALSSTSPTAQTVDGSPRPASIVENPLLFGMATGLAETIVSLPFENVKTTMVETTLDKENLEANRRAALEDSRHSLKKFDSKASSQVKHAPRTEAKSEGSAKGEAKKTRPARVQPPLPSNLKAVPLLEIEPYPYSSKAPVPISSYASSFPATVAHMYKTRGLMAFAQGFMPALCLQVTSASVLFTSYSFVKSSLTSVFPSQPSPADPAQQNRLNSVPVTLIATALSSLVTVLATQPLDTIRTRMMSTNARAVYQNGLRTAVMMVAQENGGIKSLWTGGVPRFVTLCLGGFVVGGVYEMVNDLI